MSVQRTLDVFLRLAQLSDASWGRVVKLVTLLRSQPTQLPNTSPNGEEMTPLQMGRGVEDQCYNTEKLNYEPYVDSAKFFIPHLQISESTDTLQLLQKCVYFVSNQQWQSNVLRLPISLISVYFSSILFNLRPPSIYMKYLSLNIRR